MSEQHRPDAPSAPGEPASVRVRLDLAYDGGDFHGWARQPGLDSVQGALEDGLERILRRPVRTVVAGRTDEVAVMYAGRVVERAPTPALFKQMRMPYTEALLAALPKLDVAPHTPLPAISGRPPDPTRPLKGCSFAPRCRYSAERCGAEKPQLSPAETSEHLYACFHPITARVGA